MNVPCARGTFNQNSPRKASTLPLAGDFYNSGVLDIKLIREKPDFVRQRLATRGAGTNSRLTPS